MATSMLWSGWGDPASAVHLDASVRELVDGVLGTRDTPAVEERDVVLADPLSDALLEDLVTVVGSKAVSTDHATRLRHTRGKSTPDLLRLRAGDGSDAPGAVVRPAGVDEVAAVLAWCARERVAAVPFGGGTSVVGGLVADRDRCVGVVALDLSRLDGLLDLDEESGTALLGAGLRGPEAERLLGEHGYTLGHLPQSFEHASIGGFAVTRSSGQSSAGYGRFDAMVVGLEVVTPAGRLDLGRAPSDAVGPDLRQWFLGSEGAFGVVTAVRVRIRPVPEVVAPEAWRFATFADGVRAMRSLARSGMAPSVLRLSDEAETAVNLADPSSVGSAAGGGCLLLAVHEGDERVVTARRGVTTALLVEAGGVDEGAAAGESWLAGRFRAPYLRDALLDVGVLVETLETATFWSGLTGLHAAVRTALEESLGADGSPVLVLAHVSHVYETGASLYLTVAAPYGEDPLARWAAAKRAATDAIVRAGAAVTHHHAVGRDHRPWLEQQVGGLGVDLLRIVKQRLDPAGVLNPGVLVPEESARA